MNQNTGEPTDVGARTKTMPCDDDDRTPEQPAPVAWTSRFDAILYSLSCKGTTLASLGGAGHTAVTEAQSPRKGGTYYTHTTRHGVPRLYICLFPSCKLASNCTFCFIVLESALSTVVATLSQSRCCSIRAATVAATNAYPTTEETDIGGLIMSNEHCVHISFLGPIRHVSKSQKHFLGRSTVSPSSDAGYR